MNERAQHLRFALLVVGFGTASDQITKTWAMHALESGVPLALTPFLALHLGFNTGISFGLFADGGQAAQIALVAMTAAAIAVLTWMLARGERGDAAGLSLILAGALGNLIDRLVRGRVTDFIDFHAGGWHWPAFNAADVLITSGVLWLIVANFICARQDPAKGG